MISACSCLMYYVIKDELRLFGLCPKNVVTLSLGTHGGDGIRFVHLCIMVMCHIAPPPLACFCLEISVWSINRDGLGWFNGWLGFYLSSGLRAVHPFVPHSAGFFCMPPVCSGPRAFSHQLIRCTLLKPVHTHLVTLMDWPVLTFSQRVRARVAAWPKLPHLEPMSPGVWTESNSAGTHNEVLSSLSKVSSWFFLTSYKQGPSWLYSFLRSDSLLGPSVCSPLDCGGLTVRRVSYSNWAWWSHVFVWQTEAELLSLLSLWSVLFWTVCPNSSTDLSGDLVQTIWMSAACSNFIFPLNTLMLKQALVPKPNASLNRIKQSLVLPFIATAGMLTREGWEQHQVFFGSPCIKKSKETLRANWPLHA